VIPIPLTVVASPLQAGGHAHDGAAMDHWSEWHFDPLVLLVLGALTVAYALAWRRLRLRGGRQYATIPRGIAFLCGINTLALALVSPLHHLGMDYLLSAHMVQHMMVGDIAPLLLCLGVYGPMRFFVVPRPILRWAGGPGMRPVIRQLGRPQVVFWAWVTATAVWYVPSVYTTTLDNALLHYLMWSTIFITGVAVWSHILAMVPGMRMTNAKRAGYAVGLLFAGMIVSEFLFLNDPLYQVYVDQPDRLFDLTPEADQIRASLLMTAEQMITLLMAATLIMWNHVDGAAADRAELDGAPAEEPPPNEHHEPTPDLDDGHQVGERPRRREAPAVGGAVDPLP
jgi:cytochrome c oxidase assembly factor CtaG